jgi:tetratricopeptide (TPR) repeat protein
MSPSPERQTPIPAALRARRDEVLDRFEDTWQSGGRPTVESILPADPELRRVVLPRLVAIDFERRLKAGEDVRVEDYLAPGRFPELAEQSAIVLDLIVSESSFRETPRRQLLERFPSYRDRLEALLPADGRSSSSMARRGPRLTGSLPRSFGRYRIEGVLGQGAMGVVYRAHDPVLERPVALKVPHRDAGERFLQEARAAAVLHHGNICPVYEAGVIDGVPYLTMALIEGDPLTKAFRPPLPQRQAVELVRRLALALGEAHAHGVIHRDLKPANILVDARREPIITDFGLARRILAGEARLTQPGVVLGSPAYLPPEQMAGDAAVHGPKGDIYSLGVILYELLTARLPFEGPAAVVLGQVLYVDPPPPASHRPDLDPALQAICLHALAKAPERRFESMNAFAETLASWLEARTPAAAPASPDLNDPRAAEDAHRLLREWGWEMGLRKLKAAAEQAGDEARRAALRVLVGWLAGERGQYEEARPYLEADGAAAHLAGWALAGLALVALRERHWEECRALMERALAAGREDAALRATVAHLRGTLAHHEGRSEEAIGLLCEALEGFGAEHFGAGRVLDTLGMVYAARSNFPAACEFYAASLRIKQRCGDEAGVALTNGQLGRLHLDWGLPEQADGYFRTAIAVARRTGDERGEAQMYDHRGQVLLVLDRPTEALALLDESVRSSAGRFPVVEGYARKDRAQVHLARGDLAAAEADCDAAERLFEGINFAEGVFHVHRVRGRLRLRQGRPDEAVRCLRGAAGFFEQCEMFADAARTHRDLAEAERTRGRDPALVRDALRTALELARRGRRADLAARIEADLLGVPAGEGSTGASEAALPLGVEEMATVLAVRLGRAEGEGDSPADLVLAHNHLLMDVAPALAAREVVVDQYVADGFVAVARGRDHAGRAVAAAVAVAQAIASFNRPRRLLGWPLWEVHAAVATGPVCRGEVGTVTRRERLTTGFAVRLVAGLQAETEAGLPCLAQTTRELIGERFRLRSGSRSVTIRGLGTQRVWDVLAEKN